MPRHFSPEMAPGSGVPPVGRRRLAAGLVVVGILSAGLAARGASSPNGPPPPNPDRLRIGLVGAVAVDVFDTEGRGAGCGLADLAAAEIPGADECEIEPVCPPVVATVVEVPAGRYRVRVTNVLDREVRVQVELLDVDGEVVSRRLSYRLELAGGAQAVLSYETGSSLEVKEGGDRVELAVLDTGSGHLALPPDLQDLCTAVEEEAEELTEEEAYRRMLRLLAPSYREQAEREQRQRALLQAAASGEVETVRKLLAEGAAVDGPVLLRAVAGGHREVVEVLLGAGADVNHRGPRGVTPLSSAFQADHAEVAELLLERGAEPDGRLLVKAVAAGRMDWVELLRRFGTPIDAEALVDHVRRGLGRDDGEAPGPEAVRAFDFLLAEDLWRPFEWQLLDLTLCRDDPSLARRLLEAGADLDVRSPEGDGFRGGRTPLHHAVLDGRAPCVERLLDWGADVDAAGPRGETPLLSAVRKQRLDLAGILLDAGAEPGRPDGAGTTPFLAVAGADVANVSGARRGAFLERQRALADLLLEAGADVDARDDRGSNALVLAARAGNLTMVEHLLDREATLTAETWEAMAAALDQEGWRIQLERLWRERDLPVPSLVELFPVPPAGTADARARSRTMRDLRLVGTAVLAWATDQVGAAAAPALWPVHDYRPISAGELEELLAPHYLPWVPREDGWGHPLEYRLNRGEPFVARLILIRSPGRDGRFSAVEYRPGAFPDDAYDEDVVWADGRFLRWPAEAGRPGGTLHRP